MAASGEKRRCWLGRLKTRRRSSFVQSTFRGLNLPPSHGRLKPRSKRQQTPSGFAAVALPTARADIYLALAAVCQRFAPGFTGAAAARVSKGV